MDKNNSYKGIEEKIYKEWEEKGYFKASVNKFFPPLIEVDIWNPYIKKIANYL